MQEDNYTFVSLSGQADLDVQATNKLVRSHVMQRYRRQQKATSPKKEGSPQSAEEEAISDTWASADFLSLTFLPCMDTSSTETTWSDLWAAINTNSLARQNKATSEQQFTSACPSPSGNIRTWLDGEMDPFSSLPININQRSLILLQRSKCSELSSSRSLLDVSINRTLNHGLPRCIITPENFSSC